MEEGNEVRKKSERLVWYRLLPSPFELKCETGIDNGPWACDWMFR